MGGSNAGEIASTLAVQAIHTHLAESASHVAPPLIGARDPTMSAPADRLASAIRAANGIVHHESRKRPDYAGMGTTVVAALVLGDKVAIAHVGDSRLYLIRDGTIQSLTLDHSWVAEQVGKGVITEEEAQYSPNRNIVTRALGVESLVEVELAEVSIKCGDRFLLCSDGLTRTINSEDMLPILSGTEDLATMSDRLITMANNAGGDDNTTVIIVALGDEIQESLWERLRKRFVA
jgi:protein phosphatase